MGRMINRRRACGGKSLPYDAEIEYLENQGGQFIDTLFIYKVSPRIVTECRHHYTSSFDADFFGISSTIAPSWIGNFGDGNSSWYRYGDTRAISNINAFPNGGMTWTKWDIGKKIIINSETIRTLPDYDFSTNIKKVYLFRGRSFAQCAYKNVKLYDGDSLVRDFIPVRVGNVGYMYDKVSKQLFGNQGTGQFIIGPDKIA